MTAKISYTYRLENVEERARRYPGTFEIPPLVERSKLWIGDRVKLIFSPGERMWVEVFAIETDPIIYHGRLVSTPVVACLKIGDLVEFAPENVAAIEREPR